MLGFTNNAEAALVGAIDSGDDQITVDDAGAFLGYFDDGGVQLATLTNPATPGVVEIIEIYDRAGNVLEVNRAREGTAAQAWPAGSTLSARVTAGMLASFLQGVPTDFVQTGPAPIPRSMSIMARHLQPVVQRMDNRGIGAAPFANLGFENF
jgi:hypothetical protein